MVSTMSQGTCLDIYWPDHDIEVQHSDRSRYNSSRLGALDDFGNFYSSDFTNQQPLAASDEGVGIKRRLTLDPDGNFRIYSLNSLERTWSISWIAMSQPCRIHGLCGPYGICHYSPTTKCSCPPGYEMINTTNWTEGCRAIVDIKCGVTQRMEFLKLPYTDFWGFDQQRLHGVPYEVCHNICMSDCTCKGFQY
uniref:Apple domain-containing protein n=1 Tax=Leersia perrieri TaxID=77586 RepID=A0A0D9XWK5_9ORYZ